MLELYYAKARFYDAHDRRFTAVDPILDPSQYDLREYVQNPVQLVQYLYVRNNPIIYLDPLGLVTYGYGLSGNAAFLLRAEGSASIVIDHHGNVGIMLSFGGGAGTPVIGGAKTYTVTAADTIYDLRKWGGTAGVAVAPATVGVGIDYVQVGFDKKSMAPGIMFSVDAEAKPWAEGHATASYSYVFGVNLSPYIKDLINGGIRQINSLWDSLDDNTQNSILDYLGLDYFPKIKCINTFNGFGNRSSGGSFADSPRGGGFGGSFSPK